MRRANESVAVAPLRALCIDPDASTQSWVDVSLLTARADRVQVDYAESPREALLRVSETAYDAVLLTLEGEAGGIDVISTMQEQAPELAVICLTRVHAAELSVSALGAGAQDVLARKDTDGRALARAIRFAVERQHVRTALHTKALVDELTALYNRRGFVSLARQQIKTAERLSRDVVHIFLDVDGMKQINDTFGHREGDLALLETAALLRSTFRESDVVARVGGDEFAVLALETSNGGTDALMQRLTSQLREHNARGHRPYALSFSIGSTRHSAGTPCLLDELLARADEQMYEQKRSRFSTPLAVARAPQRNPAGEGDAIR